MTSSDLPPGVPADTGQAGAAPGTVPPATRPWPPWPSRQQALGLIGAFLLGACLCGGAGLMIGAFAGSHDSHGPKRDGRDGFYRRDGDENYRRDGRFRPDLSPPAAPAVPAPPVSPTPTTPSASPPRRASPAPTASPS